MTGFEHKYAAGPRCAAALFLFVVLAAGSFPGCASSSMWRAFRFEGSVQDEQGRPLALARVRISPSILDTVAATSRVGEAVPTPVAMANGVTFPAMDGQEELRNPAVSEAVTDFDGRFSVTHFRFVNESWFLGLSLGDDRPRKFYYTVFRPNSPRPRLVEKFQPDVIECGEGSSLSAPVNRIPDIRLAVNLSKGTDVLLDVGAPGPLRAEVLSGEKTVLPDLYIPRSGKRLVRRLLPADSGDAPLRFRFRHGEAVVYEAVYNPGDLARFAWHVRVPDTPFWTPIMKLRSALRSSPGDVAAWRELGSYLALGGDLPGATHAYEQAIRLTKNDDPAALAALHVDLGRAYLDARLPRAAAQRLERAEALDPRNPRVLRSLARAQREAGDREAAVETARRAHALSPEDVDTVELLAGLLYSAGDLSGAVTLWRDAVQLRESVEPTENNQRRITQLKRRILLATPGQ